MAADTSYLRNTNAGINEQLMTAQQQLALAQALRGQSLQPIQAPSGQNGRISPLSVLAQTLNGYMGNKMVGEATHDYATAQAAQARNQMGLMASMLRGDGTQPQGDAGAPLTGTPQASYPGMQSVAPAASAGAQTGVPDASADPKWQHLALLEQFGVAPQGTAAVYAKALTDRSQPTDQIKNDQWAGVTPQQRAGITTSATMTPNQSRVQVGVDGKPAVALVAPDPAGNTQYSVGPSGTVTAQGVPGVVPAKSSLKGAEARAQADNGIITVTGPNGEQVPVRGGPAANAGTGQLGLGGGGQQGAPGAAVPGQAAPPPKLGVDPTVQTARSNQQTGMAEKWKTLNDTASNAQTVNSRLDSIKDLATRATTGQFADRLQLVNSLLSMAGSEKATDAATAKQLLDKNANQIVSQLGQGGMATDAARAIIGAAYPNSHMTKEAIAEAADNLKATNSMMVAKANLLQNHYLANNPAAYQQAESQFNAAADPRVFQWYSIKDPAQQAAFAKRAAAQDPAFRSKVQALVDMGALK